MITLLAILLHRHMTYYPNILLSLCSGCPNMQTDNWSVGPPIAALILVSMSIILRTWQDDIDRRLHRYHGKYRASSKHLTLTTNHK